MQNINKISILSGLMAVALCCSAQASTTYNLACINSGNWNSQGIRTSSSYQIGYSPAHPNEQAAYFEFDLTPAKGKTITSANLLIIGSTDYKIESYWTSSANHGNPFQFKVRCAAQCNPAYPITLAQMTTGNNSVTTWVNMQDFNRNTDIGYDWTPDGLHPGKRFDCFHYESVLGGEGGKHVGPWLQNELNAGGKWCMVTYDGYDNDKSGHRPAENYIWGSTSFTAATQLQLITK